jgi:hypothetical protein
VNKYVTLLMVVLFLIVATLVVESLYLTPTQDITTGVMSDQATGLFGTIKNVGNMISGFWKIMTFQVEGLPLAINLIVFYPLTIMVFFMVIDMIVG